MLILVSADSSLLNICVDCITIYGFLWAIPSFLDQHRLQNLSANAGRAIELTSDLEKTIAVFLRDKKNESQRKDNIFRLEYNLKALKACLALLSSSAVVKAQRDWTEQALDCVKKEPVDHQAVVEFFEHGINEQQGFIEDLQKIYHQPVSDVVKKALRAGGCLLLIAILLYNIRGIDVQSVINDFAVRTISWAWIFSCR